MAQQTSRLLAGDTINPVIGLIPIAGFSLSWWNCMDHAAWELSSAYCSTTGLDLTQSSISDASHALRWGVALRGAGNLPSLTMLQRVVLPNGIFCRTASSVISLSTSRGESTTFFSSCKESLTWESDSNTSLLVTLCCAIAAINSKSIWVRLPFSKLENSN